MPTTLIRDGNDVLQTVNSLPNGFNVDTYNSWTISAIGRTSSWIIPEGTQRVILVYGVGATNCNLNPQYSTDGGTTWANLVYRRVDAVATSVLAVGNVGNISGQAVIEVDVAGLDLYLMSLNVATLTAGSLIIRAAPKASPISSLGVNAVVTGTITAQVRPAINVADGASTFHHLISAATTNLTSVKATNAQLARITVSNNGAAVAYFKMYNKASAPVLASDTPVATILVPVNGTVVIDDTGWVRHATGLAYAITGGMAVTDATAVAAGQVAVSIAYT
jgi:hypothetical protein